jgi:putative membrane protein
MMIKGILAGIVVFGLAAAPAVAGQQSKTADKTDRSTKSGSSPDQNFVSQAALDGMAEVELGKLAVEKAASDEVKNFGQRMLDDHGRAGDELKTLAQNKQITLPTGGNPHAKAMHDRLAKLSGAAFDRAYMQAMVVDHRKAVNQFRLEARSGKDADVKAWAAKTLPTLEEHLKLAQEANRAVGTSGTKSKTKTSK